MTGFGIYAAEAGHPACKQKSSHAKAQSRQEAKADEGAQAISCRLLTGLKKY